VLRNYRARPCPGDSTRLPGGRAETTANGTAAVAARENDVVILTIDDIERLLASGADRPVEVAETGTDGSGTPSPGEMPFTHLDHALQTAAVLRHDFPDDVELAVAGLVHDIGHLLPGVGDAEHAEVGGEAVRAALGEGVAGPVGLHVEAKRYLVARQSAYGERLAADSVASLGLQGGPMSTDEQRAFERLPHARRALDLRRADERGKVDGLEVAGLGEWMERVRALSTAP
jgi:predicted HD phosphohydrolase